MITDTMRKAFAEYGLNDTELSHVVKIYAEHMRLYRSITRKKNVPESMHDIFANSVKLSVAQTIQLTKAVLAQEENG